MDEEMKCRICFENFTLTVQRPRFLECGHILCTVCCAKLLNKPSVICPLCKKKLITKVNDASELPFAPQIEDILRMISNKHDSTKAECAVEELYDDHAAEPAKLEKAFIKVCDDHEPEEPKTRILLSEYCDEHLNENIFFCENHNKFVCQSCCIIEHSNVKCKIMKKKYAFKNYVAKCHAEINSKKDEFIEYNTKVKIYITILKKEEYAHSLIQESLSKLSLKHEEKKIYLESERIKMENFLAEQEKNIEKLDSLKYIANVSTIQKAKELTDETANVTMIMKNKMIAEEKRCDNFKQLDVSIKERKSTLQEVKTITDTHEVEEVARDLRGGGPSWRMKMVIIILMLIDISLEWLVKGQASKVINSSLINMPILFGLTLVVYLESKLLGKRVIYTVVYFAELVFERLLIILLVITITELLGDVAEWLGYVTFLGLVVSVPWMCIEVSNKLGLIDTVAWHGAGMCGAVYCWGAGSTLKDLLVYIGVSIGSLWIFPAVKWLGH